MRILIVDDSSFMRKMLRRLLEKNGYEVVGEGENGIDAIEMCEKLKPDVVTLDVVMPKMGGLEALEHIRESSPSISVIMMTSMGQDWMVEQAVQSGARGYILKPYKEIQIISILKRLGED